MGSPCILHQMPMDRLSVDCPWNVHGLSMDWTWASSCRTFPGITCISRPRHVLTLLTLLHYVVAIHGCVVCSALAVLPCRTFPCVHKGLDLFSNIYPRARGCFSRPRPDVFSRWYWYTGGVKTLEEGSTRRKKILGKAAGVSRAKGLPQPHHRHARLLARPRERRSEASPMMAQSRKARAARRSGIGPDQGRKTTVAVPPLIRKASHRPMTRTHSANYQSASI